MGGSEVRARAEMDESMPEKFDFGRLARVAMARSTNDMYDIALQLTTAAHRGRLGQRSCIA